MRVQVRARGLLFDMDGVLISSIGSVERAWTKWAKMQGLDSQYVLQNIHGQRSIDSIRSFRPDLDAQAENIRIEDWEMNDSEDLELLAGVMPILEHLPQKYWTIVTSATGRLARARLALASVPVPERIITADMVSRGKPDPEPYLRGAELLGLKPEDCVVIEDSASGAKAGRAAGCKVLATTFSHAIEALGSADWVVESLQGVSVTVLDGDAGLEIEFEPLQGKAQAPSGLGSGVISI